MRLFGFVGILAGMLTATAFGQEAVTIKVARPGAGDKIKVVKLEKMTSKITFALAGKSETKDEVESKSIVYLDEVVTPGVDSGKPLKLTRTYEKYEAKKGDKDLPAPPLNTPILIEKKGGKYIAEGKGLDAAAAARIAGELDRNSGSSQVELLLPGKPVKPGDSWKVDVSKLPGIAGDTGQLVVDADASTLSGKLIKTYKKNGNQFGVLEYTGEVVIKSLGEKSPLKLKNGSKMGMKFTVDACIDGNNPSVKSVGSLKITLEGEGGGVSISLTGNGTMESSDELLPK
jgi:hypothetical protein